MTVNPGFTRNHRGDNSDYEGMVRRVILAHGRRVARSDPEDLIGLLTLHDVIDQAIMKAIDGLRAAGFSWTDIGRGLGTTRQNAFQRFGKSRGTVCAVCDAVFTGLAPADQYGWECDHAGRWRCVRCVGNKDLPFPEGTIIDELRGRI